ncbi:DNA cytosine methyltransferase [Enterobacter asburiae]|uniref:DNA cytosine methyltransferase n=1 Tax=Enterobacter asburiae TaxID=61645 RepID=UPI0020050757|nr:DNA cytosine methyltransferase [Enterobacter asburiae]MCK6686436.1 DNA cytosine methyltransferase [Enterobacter asburiae]
MNKLLAIDLFSGGGGLSQGLVQAGYDVVAAVELDSNAISTYEQNHPSTKLISHDIRLVSANALQSLLKGGALDLLAACPPCQGFSSLTSANKIEDPRNSLIMEVGRLVRELKPRTLMIENVPGLMTRGRSYLSAFLKILDQEGYIYSYKVLQVADYGVPQFRKRFVLLAGLGFEIPIPEQTHSGKPTGDKLPWLTVNDAISNMPESIELPQSYLMGGPEALNWHVTRSISDMTKKRLEYIKPGGSRFDLPDELRPDCHKGNNNGFSNVYGRMSWDKPSPTITSGCTTLSKGRFGHPDRLRTISIREAALLQTFPYDYKFNASSIDSICRIIGNALPCKFAEVMALTCRSYALKYCTKNRATRIA